MRKLRVYIASPLTLGDTGANIKKSMMTFDLLMDLGFAPYCPLTTFFLHIHTPRPYRDWIDHDLEWIPACDIILRLPGKSSGADGEEKLMISLSKPVFYDIIELLEYVKSKEKWFKINPDLTLNTVKKRFSEILELKV